MNTVPHDPSVRGLPWLVLLAVLLILPHSAFAHSDGAGKHDLKKLEPKPEGMIEFEEKAPGSEYGTDQPKEGSGPDLSRGLDLDDAFFTRGAHKEGMKSKPLTKGQALLARGRNIYLHMCVYCHGKDGNGGGTATDYLYPWPRDFRKGIFKFRSTPTGTLPRDEDLYRTIIRGVPGTSMPAWKDALSPQDTWALVNLIKSFSTRFRNEPPGQAVAVTPVPSSPQLVQRGKELFQKNKCVDCHGQSLKGDGPNADSLIDAWKHAVFVHDLTLPNELKSGYLPEDIYRSITNGLDGTPMESYAHLPDEDRWALVHYIRSKFQHAYHTAGYETDIFSHYVDSQVLPDPQDPVWNDAKSIDLHLRPLSARRGAVEIINVASVNNGETIAFRLRWKDPTKDGFVENRGDVFRDGVAIQVALGEVTLHTHGHNEPFFGMGNRGKPVNIWHWKAGLEETLEASEESEYSTGGVDMDALIFGGVMSNPIARLNTTSETQVEELNSEGFGTITPQRPELQNVEGYGVWENGEWSVVFTRQMETTSKWDANFLDRQDPALIAFAVWDGTQEDRNGRKVISVWQRLHVLKAGQTEAQALAKKASPGGGHGGGHGGMDHGAMDHGNHGGMDHGDHSMQH